MGPLAELVAVVTGAGSGIGQAIAKEISTRGANLAVIGRRLGPLESMCKLAQESGVRARAYSADISIENDVSKLGAAILSDFGRTDILVHCAGNHVLAPIAEASVGDFDTQYRTNLLGPFMLTQNLLPSLV